MWRSLLRDLLAVIPPFTLWSAARLPGNGLAVNVAILAAIVGTMSALIALTGDSAQWLAFGLGLYSVASWAQCLRISDRPCAALTFGTPLMAWALLGFGGLAITTYVTSFWAAPFALRNFPIDAKTAGLMLGVPGAIASAIGVVIGGKLSDSWKAKDPRGRVFTCMIAAVAPLPFLVAQYYAPSFALYAGISFVVYLFANMWVGSAVAVYQDFVLPRMYGMVTAIYLLGSSMIGLAIGPYASGKVAAATGDLRFGVLSTLLLCAPITLFSLWRLSCGMERVETSKVDRARAVGEPEQEELA
jgi:hypothetical protein